MGRKDPGEGSRSGASLGQRGMIQGDTVITKASQVSATGTVRGG